MTEKSLSFREQEQLIQRELSRWSSAVQGSSLSQERLPRDIQEVLDHAHAHLFDERLSVSSIRRACRISNHNITSRFRLFLGSGLHGYIEMRRMEAASVLLKNPQLTIYLISAAVGYAHPESFNRAFKRRFDCSPAVYRKQLLDLDQEEMSG